MKPEKITEWYQFRCTGCGQRWTARYEVRRSTDDAGQVRSYYMRDGLPCEAPALAQESCPACGRAPVHAELLAGPPDNAVPAPHAPAARDGNHAEAHRLSTVQAWRRFTFEATVSLDEADGGDIPDEGLPPQSVTHLPVETRSLMVRLPHPDLPGAGDFMPAVITRDDGRRLRPGDRHVIVRISVPRGEATGTISAGTRFALWSGTDVGHGTVLRRVLFD